MSERMRDFGISRFYPANSHHMPKYINTNEIIVYTQQGRKESKKNNNSSTLLTKRG